MKKTLTINLNGRVFNIDEDAYELLDNYFRNLRIYFRKEEGYTEIIADFEARIEELLSNRIRLGYDVINIEEVEKVIVQMGSPDDFGEKERETDSSDANKETETNVKKKFYRDADDKKIAGIFSGMAAYFNCEALPIRIIAIILLFGSSGLLILAYFIVWIAVPEAKTAEQKLEMQGKPITVENIGKTVAAEAEKSSKNEPGGCLGSIVDFFVAVLKVGVVGLGCLVGIPLIFALFMLIIALFAAVFGVGTGLFSAIGLPVDIPITEALSFVPTHPTLAAVSLFFLLAIPLLALIYAIISYIFKLKPVHKSVKWTGLTAWIIALILLFSSGYSGYKLPKWNTKYRPILSLNFHRASKIQNIEGNGILADRTESLSNVEFVELSGNLDASLQIEPIEGENASLLINGDANLIDKIEVRNENGNLRLSTANYLLRPSAPIIIRLQTADLKRFSVQGASRANVSGVFQTDELTVNAIGASKLTINDLHLNSLRASASGASEIFLSGMAEKAELRASGASKIFALDLVANTVDARASGSSFINCNPIERFTGTASGASKIKYKQIPKNGIESRTFGAGKISQE